MKFIFLGIFFFYCSQYNQQINPKKFVAEKGILDLRNWDIEKDGVIRLDGEWEFFWKELITPDDTNLQSELYFPFPKVWNNVQINGKKFSADGYASFRLKLLLPDHKVPLGIRALQQSTAFKLMVLGKEIGSGKVGTNSSESVPLTIPKLLFLPDSNTEELVLVLQVSNFHHRNGGIWNSIYLGSHDDINNFTNQSKETAYFFSGFFLFIIIYHIGFYLIRRNEKASLLFSFFCISVLLRVATTDDKILTDIPIFSDFEVFVRIEYLSSFFAPAFAFHFVQHLFPIETKRFLVNLFYSIAVLFSLSLFFPVRYFSYTTLVYQVILVIVPLILFYIVFKAKLNKRDYSNPIIIGAFSILCTNIYDLLVLNQVIPPTRYLLPYGVMILSFSQAVSILMKFSYAFKQKEILSRELISRNEIFSKFVPSEFIGLLNKKDITELELGSQVQKKMTVLFADIREFTSISERMSPEENFEFLNSYLKIMTPCIKSNNGFIDKFIGDAIMAIFPSQPDDALKAAILMQRELSGFNRAISKKGFLPIKIGIGIHIGSLIIGTIGSEDRMESTVISDAVNLAARIENLTKTYGANILISLETLLELDDMDKYFYRILDRVQVKGKTKLVSVVEILDGKNALEIELFMQTKLNFETALQEYLMKDFKSSITKFENVLELNPLDQAARLYLEKATKYNIQGVPSEWIGLN
jgi:class 3 adenylate cyclase